MVERIIRTYYLIQMNKEDLQKIAHSLKELERKQQATEQAKAESRQAEEAQNKAREARRESLRQMLYGPNSRPITFIVPQESKLTE